MSGATARESTSLSHTAACLLQQPPPSKSPLGRLGNVGAHKRPTAHLFCLFLAVVGRLYRGDWSHGRMHGCGTAIWKQPGAGEGEVAAAEGKFFSNEFVGDVMPCSKEDGYDSAVEADVAAFQARSFLQVSQVSTAAPDES